MGVTHVYTAVSINGLAPYGFLYCTDQPLRRSKRSEKPCKWQFSVISNIITFFFASTLSRSAVPTRVLGSWLLESINNRSRIGLRPPQSISISVGLNVRLFFRSNHVGLWKGCFNNFETIDMISVRSHRQAVSAQALYKLALMAKVVKEHFAEPANGGFRKRALNHLCWDLA